MVVAEERVDPIDCQFIENPELAEGHFIKGNVSRNGGRRIYHLPGDPDYAKTRISASHGER